MRNLLIALTFFFILTACDSPAQLEAPEPCAEYELLSTYDGEAVFERDITVTVDVSEYEGTLEKGEMYMICSSAGELYIK